MQGSSEAQPQGLQGLVGTVQEGSAEWEPVPIAQAARMLVAAQASSAEQSPVVGPQPLSEAPATPQPEVSILFSQNRC